jgi:hypothetical protein
MIERPPDKKTAVSRGMNPGTAAETHYDKEHSYCINSQYAAQGALRRRILRRWVREYERAERDGRGLL